MTIKKTASGVLPVLALLCLGSQPSNAQPKKGDKEVLAFSSGFVFSFGGDIKIGSLEGQGFFSSSFRVQSFSLGGDLGYFLTSRNEIGGGLAFSATRFRSCFKSFSNGQVTSESCNSDSNVGLGLSGFYRYNFVRGEAKGFPFVGGTISAASVTDNFTGNVRARPHVGYKYFLKKSVALDFSVGYTVDLNKVDDPGPFIRDRNSSIDGRLGLSFVF
jgi:hypothetical protein